MRSLIGGFVLLICTITAYADWEERQTGTVENFFGISIRGTQGATVVGGNGTILYTEDDGFDWGPQEGEPDIEYHAVSFADHDTGVIAGTGGTILFTTNAGDEWQTIETGWMHPYYAAHQSTALIGAVAGVNSIFQPIVGITADGWETYPFHVFYPDHNGSSQEGTIRDIYFFDAMTGVAVIEVWDGQGAFCATANGGESWSTTQWSGDALFGVDFWDATHGCAVGNDGTVYTTENGGTIWEQHTMLTDANFRSVSFGSANEVWAVGEGGTIFYSADGGADWSQQESPVGINLNAVSFANADTGYIAGDNGVVLYTANGGAGGNNLPREFVRTLPADSDTLDTPEVNFTWTASSDPDGQQVTYLARVWSNYFGNWADSTVTTETEWTVVVPWPLTHLDDYFSFWWSVYATDGIDTIEASNGQGAFTMDIILGTDDPFIPQPSDLTLSAYPNPFNPATTLNISLPSPSETTLRVFDVTGRLVREQRWERLESGSHAISFDGRELPSGIYVAAVETPAQRVTQKLVLMK